MNVAKGPVFSRDLYTGRIVGGEPVDYPRQLHFLVSLQTRRGEHFCGGSLISKRWILTAAHCTQGTVGLVRVGVHDRLDAASDECVQTRNVARVINHPQYNGMTLENDVSLLELDADVEGYEEVTLAGAADSGLESAGVPLTVAGWGTTSEGGSLSDVPMRVDVPVVSHAQCEVAYGAGAIADGMLCAGYDGGSKDSCQGDSGGPLFDEGRNVLLGIVSWGEGCAREGRPGVYSRVSTYKSWVCSSAGVGCDGTSPGPAPSPSPSPTPSPTPSPDAPLEHAPWAPHFGLESMLQGDDETLAELLVRCKAACDNDETAACVGFQRGRSSGTNICRFKIGASNDDSAGLPFFTTSTRLFVRAAASGRRDSRDAMCAGGLVDQNGNPITDEHGNAVVQEGGAAGLAAAIEKYFIPFMGIALGICLFACAFGVLTVQCLRLCFGRRDAEPPLPSHNGVVVAPMRLSKVQRSC